jgi:hypothetical protein
MKDIREIEEVMTHYGRVERIRRTVQTGGGYTYLSAHVSRYLAVDHNGRR